MAKYALCIGVSDYSNWRSGGSGPSDLAFGVTSAEQFRDLLIDAFLFPEANIRMMRNAWASKGNIVQCFQDLVDTAQPGDVVCIFFSGHGGLIPGVAPGGQPEPDRYYETLVPHSGAMITDFEFEALSNRLRPSEVNLTIVLDSCHSAGMSPIEGAPRPRGSLTASPPGLAACRSVKRVGLCLPGRDGLACVPGEQAKLTIAPADQFVDQARATLLSACRTDQSSWDAPSLRGSVFMTAMRDIVNQSGLRVSNTEFVTQLGTKAQTFMASAVNSIPRYANERSEPQLYGQRNRMGEDFLVGFADSR